MLDLLNAEVLEGTELEEVGGRETILTQQSPPEGFCINSGVSHLTINCEGQSYKATFY